MGPQTRPYPPRAQKLAESPTEPISQVSPDVPQHEKSIPGYEKSIPEHEKSIPE